MRNDNFTLRGLRARLPTCPAILMVRVETNGLVVRVKLDKNRRIFTPTRASHGCLEKAAVGAPVWSVCFRDLFKAAVSSGTIYAGR